MTIAERLEVNDSPEELYDELLSVEGLQEATDEYFERLRIFIDTYDLWELFDGATVDHVAIKLEDKQDYLEHVESLSNESSWIISTPMDDREISTAKLRDPMRLHGLGTTRIVEIMEPKPGKSGGTGLDHIEVLSLSTFEDIRALLDSRNIRFTLYSNERHSAVVVQINDEGQEVKFTDGRLEDIALVQAACGESYWRKKLPGQPVGG